MNTNNVQKRARDKKIVLGMLPYWTPLVPPQGIGMLKAYLEKHDYTVKIIDLNVHETFKKVYTDYFNKIGEFVPMHNRGNFYNIGHDVLHNHMMAAIKYTDETKYIKLVKTLVYHSFYTKILDTQAIELNRIMQYFYEKLEEYYIELIKVEQPGVLGFSIFKGNIPAAIFAARVAKRENKSIKVVMGGGAFTDFHALGSPNFEALLQETVDCVDLFIVDGQGEKVFLKYLEGELSDRRVASLKELNLAPIPFHDLDIADLSDLDTGLYPYIIATGSASCPNECTFCNASKFYGRYREKNAKQVVQEMLKMYRKYGKQLFFMSDSLLNHIVTDIATEFINLGTTLYYDCYFRVDDNAADLDKTMLWRRGGLYRTRLGIESGSQKILDLMNKKITLEQSKATLYGLASAGIKTTAYIVIGHPYETEEDFQMTLDFVDEMKDYIWQAEPNPFYYHYTGQFGADDWKDKRMLLYPEEARSMLVFDTWTLNCEPLREERYERLHRFTAHCDKLGIPNPYTASEIHAADERWHKLHKNAVPSVWEFETWGKYIDEARNVVRYAGAKNVLASNTDFDF